MANTTLNIQFVDEALRVLMIPTTEHMAELMGRPRVIVNGDTITDALTELALNEPSVEVVAEYLAANTGYCLDEHGRWDWYVRDTSQPAFDPTCPICTRISAMRAFPGGIFGCRYCGHVLDMHPMTRDYGPLHPRTDAEWDKVLKEIETAPTDDEWRAMLEKANGPNGLGQEFTFSIHFTTECDDPMDIDKMISWVQAVFLDHNDLGRVDSLVVAEGHKDVDYAVRNIIGTAERAMIDQEIVRRKRNTILDAIKNVAFQYRSVPGPKTS